MERRKSKLVLLLLIAALSGDAALAFPGKRLFGAIKERVDKVKNRGKVKMEATAVADDACASTTEASNPSASAAEPPRAEKEAAADSLPPAATAEKGDDVDPAHWSLYPPGALPLLKEATLAYTSMFGHAPTMAAHAPGKTHPNFPPKIQLLMRMTA